MRSSNGVIDIAKGPVRVGWTEGEEPSVLVDFFAGADIAHH